MKTILIILVLSLGSGCATTAKVLGAFGEGMNRNLSGHRYCESKQVGNTVYTECNK